ncbi:glutathione ABC transporter substrate-binding protein [Sporosarcina sp. G11-34]|uniref:glutathione ABC transporter substrate-binding protein n=1 Tax=Sporosarcina sp. G11-34 TaxID=2849605 RepID=UPI0022A9EA84|nr:glutathione ABC transporter substrate-binding protein [Sporosarcina sp. G11-34]MCZ2259009.1 glutathione ABC transporter substrate-binding protein [Sporosarcina sp. G11-34]
MGKSNKKWFFAIILLLSMILAACAGDGSGSDKDSKSKDNTNDNKDKAEEKGTGEPIEGGDLVIAAHSDASTMDPAGSNDVPSSNIQFNIFENLVKRDADNNLIPSLAEEWEAIDETTYEFKLREGVKFHDGEIFNADAVKASLDRILDPKVASSKYNTFEMISNVEVVDDYTVRITTEYPFSPIITHLTHGGGAIISPKSIEADYAAMEKGEDAGSVISQNPVGTGYFKFESWAPGSEVKLVRNEEYWDKLAHVDTVTFKIVPESGTRKADLERGFAQVIEHVQPNEVAVINDSDHAKIIQTPSTALTFIGFNLNKPPFDDVKVRRAVSMMVNKQEVIDGVYDGFAIPAEGPLAPKSFGYSPDLKGIEYDVEEAKKLMKEAGYEDGFKASIWTNDNPQRIDIAVLLQDTLKELNIEITVEQMEFGAYLEKLRAGEHNMFMLSWSNSLADGDNGLFSLFHSSVKGVPPNATWYGSPVVDDLLDGGRHESDPDKRAQIYKEAQEELVKDAPLIFLNHPEYLTGVSNSITGFSVDTSNILHLRDVQFVK